MDAGMWLCGLTTNHFALNAINSRNRLLEGLVIGFVTLANIIGSKLGQWIGDKYFPDPIKAEMRDIEGRLKAIYDWAIAQGFAPPVK